MCNRVLALSGEARSTEAERLLEDAGPGVSLEGMAAGRMNFQQYLEQCTAQAGSQAAGASNKQTRSALRYA